ncbi:MAG TPA: Crp/Fnr family transcriptional regulator [Bacteroidia bacterium]|nr:Crp/Fnr family transcriptional regulator [Bacteroidia bacterium]
MELSVERIRSIFPDLNEQELIDELLQSEKIYSFAEGSTIIESGQYIKHIPLVLSGTIKVMRGSSEGHELFLYFIQAGQTCAMSLSCCVNAKPSEISARVEDDCELLMIPIEKMDHWMQKYASWRNLIMNAYNNRFQELISVIDSVAFKKMDERLKSYLSEKFQVISSDVLSITHQTIADEMGSSREVISRLLKQMENEHLIRLQRNQIKKLKDLST